MAGTVVMDSVQLGNSATASQNLVITSNKDGSFKISRGNLGATTQDILTIDANGIVGNKTLPVFRVSRRTATAVFTTNVSTKVTMVQKDYDPNNIFDLANSKITPTLPGYWFFWWNVWGNGGGSTGLQETASAVYKNGVAAGGSDVVGGATIYIPSYPVSDFISTGSEIVSMNGTTDYIELYARLVGAGTLSVNQAWLAGYYLRPL